MEPLYRYHFSLGDSSTGAVGFCASVVAQSKHEAVELLRDILPEDSVLTENEEDGPHVSYVTAYFNADAVTVDDIDEVEQIALSQDEAIERLADDYENLLLSDSKVRREVARARFENMTPSEIHEAYEDAFGDPLSMDG